MIIHTIGFTKSSAEDFFLRLEQAGVKRVIDVRLNNTSQLSGFAKSRELKFFLQRISGIGYQHELSLAPTAEMLNGFKKGHITWEQYEVRFLELMSSRKIENKLNPDLFDDACLLCSENTAHHCHRRLVAEYLKTHWQAEIKIVHL